MHRIWSGGVGWTKLPTDRQSITKLVADLSLLVCIAEPNSPLLMHHKREKICVRHPCSSQREINRRRIEYSIYVNTRRPPALSGVPVPLCQRATVPTLSTSMRRLGAVQKRLLSRPRNLASSTSRRSGTLIRSAPVRTLARERHRMGTWPSGDWPSYSCRITKNRLGRGWGVPPGIHSIIASVALRAKLDGFLLGPATEIYGRTAQLSPGQTGGGGRKTAEANTPRPPLPRRPRTRPDL